MEAQSRLTLLGHLDPQFGRSRAGSHAAPPLAALVRVTFAMATEWALECFDAAIAFLSGLKLEREVHARRPGAGCQPSTALDGQLRDPMRCVACRRARGLTEALRFWYF